MARGEWSCHLQATVHLILLVSKFGVLGLELNGKDLYLQKQSGNDLWAEKPWKQLGDLTPNQAVHNERVAYDQTMKGLWSQEDFQYYNVLAATSGNIDSARQLLEFAVKPTLQLTAGSPIHEAVYNNDLEMVKTLIQDGVDVDEPKIDGSTPLHACAALGRAKIARLLLDHRANIEATADHGGTPLMLAAAAGHANTIELFLKYGADPNARHKFAGSTAMHFAAETGKSKAIKSLCKGGADPDAEKLQGSRPLHVAAEVGAAGAIRALLACGADPDAKLMGDTTPLYVAAQNGKLTAVRALLDGRAAGGGGAIDVNYAMPQGSYDSALAVPGEYGADINGEIGNGATALHAAAEEGHAAVAALLLDRGTSHRARMAGVQPLALAVQYNRAEMVSLLLKQGADPNDHSTSDGATALYYSSGHYLHEMTKLLLAGGADPNAVTFKHATPLFYASGVGDLQTAKMLLAAGADPDIQTDELARPIHAAVEGGHTKIVRLLIKHGAQIEPAGPNHQTPLLLAALYGHSQIAADLLAQGADVNQPLETTGAAPLAVAAQGGHAAVCALLLGCGAAPDARGGNHGATALHRAAQRGRAGAVQVLLEGGADPSLPLNTGTLPIHFASEKGFIDIARLLLAYDGTSLTSNALDHQGIAPLHMAAYNGHVNSVELLLSFGASVDIPCKAFGNSTALILATKQGHLRTVQVLLKASANKSIADSTGKTASDYALERRDYDLINTLASDDGFTDEYSPAVGGGTLIEEEL